MRDVDKGEETDIEWTRLASNSTYLSVTSLSLSKARKVSLLGRTILKLFKEEQ